jgi:hypothetical protein
MDYEIAGIGESRSLVRWAFEKDLNAVSEPTEVGDSYFVAIITGEEKVGLASVASVKPQIEITAISSQPLGTSSNENFHRFHVFSMNQDFFVFLKNMFSVDAM